MTDTYTGHIIRDSVTEQYYAGPRDGAWERWADNARDATHFATAEAAEACRNVLHGGRTRGRNYCTTTSVMPRR